jgi:predicted RNA-binding protein associated with RNAse of E/G family
MMRINFRYKNLWGEEKRREMDIIFQDNTMMIAQYTIENTQQPLIMNDEHVLENGFTAVSFIEFGKWYIIDKIFNLEATPTGYLAKLATPVEENMTFISTMDLFIKFWITPQNEYQLYGNKVFKEVTANGLMDQTVKTHAQEAMKDLLSRIEQQKVPTHFMKEFTVQQCNI